MLWRREETSLSCRDLNPVSLIPQLSITKLQVVTSQKNASLILTFSASSRRFLDFVPGKVMRNGTVSQITAYVTRHFALTFQVITGLFNYRNPNSCFHVSIGNKFNIPNMPYLHKSHYTDRFGGSSHNNADEDMKI